ncbi:winged helix-turn-helix domain-containing protein [Pseudoalteromonas rubra]|uniref:OmpR/PhoB-type domain-containing protein n=1 Tax=Pseudoalteromonas rubra TaxID=43658 RepID=A0A0U2XYJ0_9GAMM|nr:winged helix-turn-helix domain-containing protein [Pseudoalteromonas rubra]ALU43074.1 hypothetical protein AT705_09030 [Pseudoalteromonas rubra]
MAQTRFFIDAYEIDLSRSVVIFNDQHTHVEPKVLQVLLLLAQRQREHGEQVVTHQEIMMHVWQGVEVVPNALQRCIAILRKVLGDNAKNPTVIATHPKIGYRLLVPVRWPEAESKPAETESRKSYLKLAITLVSTLLLGTLVYLNWPTKPLPEYTRLIGVTHTDAHESHALFSPDGQYVIFNRYAGSCSSHLWARHLDSGKEFQLSNIPGQFGAPSFTPDGRELVFAAKADCDQDIVTDKTHTCWALATLDFAQAIAAPQPVESRYVCSDGQSYMFKALPNHAYAFLQRTPGRNLLMHYDDLSKTVRPLYHAGDEYLYHFDYHRATQRFAVLSQDNQLNHWLTILNNEAQRVQRTLIPLQPNMDPNEPLPGRFTPDGNALLAVSHGQLYHLDLNGDLSRVATPTSHLISADRHPTSDTLIAVNGGKDIDIARLQLSQNSPTAATPMPEPDLNTRSVPYPSLSRTQAQERQPQYSPDGRHIAFISNRNGVDQLWLLQGEQTMALSDAISPTPIHQFVWSADGQELLWAQGGKLHIVNLSGQQRIIDTNLPVHSVLAWGDKDQLLVLLNDPVPGGLYHYNLATGEQTPLGVNQIHRAWLVRDSIYYSDENGKVAYFQVDQSPSQARELSALNGHAMVITDNAIFSVDKTSLQLSQYSLNGTLIKPLGALKPTAWKINDVYRGQLLLEQFIGIEQEVVLLK